MSSCSMSSSSTSAIGSSSSSIDPDSYTNPLSKKYFQEILNDQVAILNVEYDLRTLSQDGLDAAFLEASKRAQDLFIKVMLQGPYYFCSMIAGVPVDFLKDRRLEGVLKLAAPRDEDDNDDDEVISKVYRGRMSIYFTSESEDSTDTILTHTKFGKLGIKLPGDEMWTIRMYTNEITSEVTIHIVFKNSLKGSVVLTWTGTPKYPSKVSGVSVPIIFLPNGKIANIQLVVDSLGQRSNSWVGNFYKLTCDSHGVEKRVEDVDALPYLVQCIAASAINQLRLSYDAIYVLDVARSEYSAEKTTPFRVVGEYLGCPPIDNKYLAVKSL